MSNRSMIKRVTAFLMTLTVVCLNIFTAEMIHALADSIPEKSLEGTMVWDESWEWKGLTAPGTAFRPSQQGNNAFQLVLKGDKYPRRLYSEINQYRRNSGLPDCDAGGCNGDKGR